MADPIAIFFHVLELMACAGVLRAVMLPNVMAPNVPTVIQRVVRVFSVFMIAETA